MHDAAERLQVQPEPAVLAMIMKQAAAVVRQADPEGVTSILTALAQLGGPGNRDARAVFCIAHAQLLRTLRGFMPRTGAFSHPSPRAPRFLPPRPRSQVLAAPRGHAA